jgi:hypothetical protein
MIRFLPCSRSRVLPGTRETFVALAHTRKQYTTERSRKAAFYAKEKHSSRTITVCVGLALFDRFGPSERYHQQRNMRHKTIPDWAWPMILQVSRWIPGRQLVVVADGTSDLRKPYASELPYLSAPFQPWMGKDWCQDIEPSMCWESPPDGEGSCITVSLVVRLQDS